jgi:hypothetical protein
MSANGGGGPNPGVVVGGAASSGYKNVELERIFKELKSKNSTVQ